MNGGSANGCGGGGKLFLHTNDSLILFNAKRFLGLVN